MTVGIRIIRACDSVRFLLLAFSIILFVQKIPCLAQSTSTTNSAIFEVASVRHAKPGAGLTTVSSPDSPGFSARNISFRLLLQLAFGVEVNQIATRMRWINDEYYDISARSQENVAISSKQLRPLLQNLLETRFHLVSHREMETINGYALQVAKGGFKLTPTSLPPAPGYILVDGLQSKSMTMETLAKMLANPTGKPVINRTEILGCYEIDLAFAPQNLDDSRLPSIYSALRDQLGLQLRPVKVPVEMLIVDSANVEPTSN